MSSEKKSTLRRSKIFRGGVLFLLVLGVWIAFNLFPIWRDYLFGPPVRFLKNEHVRLGLYPEGRPAAVVFTNDDAGGLVSAAAIDRINDFLNRMGIKGTFFVVPAHYGAGALLPGSPQAEALQRLKASGHEIAQHGFMHWCEKNLGRGLEAGAEMLVLDREEQRARIRAGRALLELLGLSPVGHRAPCFSATGETMRVLDELGFLYGSDLNLPATIPETFLTPAFRGRIMYPYHPQGLRLLEVTCQADPTVRPDKALMVFERFWRRGGAFVFLTHLPQISTRKNLARLKRAIDHFKSRKVWICRLDELCRWWLARESVEVETKIVDDCLEIRYRNPSPYALENAAFYFLSAARAPARYRVLTHDGDLVAAGRLPPSGRILVALPPTD